MVSHSQFYLSHEGSSYSCLTSTEFISRNYKPRKYLTSVKFLSPHFPFGLILRARSLATFSFAGFCREYRATPITSFFNDSRNRFARSHDPEIHFSLLSTRGTERSQISRTTRTIFTFSFLSLSLSSFSLFTFSNFSLLRIEIFQNFEEFYILSVRDSRVPLGREREVWVQGSTRIFFFLVLGNAVVLDPIS